MVDPEGDSARRAPWREVHCEDALAWMERAGVLRGCSLITSLPDASELPELSLEDWKRWFVASARRVVSSCPPEGVAIFYQTDIKREGTWVDKGYLVSRGAEECGAALLWHKVVCRRPPGTVTFGRPAYAHLLCFSAGVRDAAAHSTADVLPELGEMTWSKAMGAEACALACRYVRDRTATRTAVDPFCGVGTVLAVANALGLDSIGVELSRKRARRARSLRWSESAGFSGGRVRSSASRP